MDFDKFLEKLIAHEEQKTKEELTLKRKKEGSREEIMVYSGVRLNWLGDFLGNPALKWEERKLSLDDIEFTGNDEFLIKDCQRSPIKFREIVNKNPDILAKYKQHINSLSDEPILVRTGDKKFKILDGTHRLIAAALAAKNEITAMVPLNENEVLPYCEAHTIYDLIRGFLRNAKDAEGEKELYYGLKLLLRTYANTEKLLRERFNKHWVDDDKVQEIIGKVLKND